MAACSARLAVLSGAQGACVRLRRAPAAPHVGPALVVGVRHTAALLQRRAPALRRRSAPAVAASGAAAQPGPPVGGLSAEEKAHLATVAAKVASCAQRLKRASWLGFWSQLSLSVVSAVIVVFSIVFKGVTKARKPGCALRLRVRSATDPNRPPCAHLLRRARTRACTSSSSASSPPSSASSGRWATAAWGSACAAAWSSLSSPRRAVRRGARAAARHPLARDGWTQRRAAPAAARCHAAATPRRFRGALTQPLRLRGAGHPLADQRRHHQYGRHGRHRGRSAGAPPWLPVGTRLGTPP